MTWVRLEDDMPTHPKILRLSDGAFRLWLHGLSHANRRNTDGKIDKDLVPSLNPMNRWSSRQIKNMIAELSPGLWIDAGTHYMIRDYEHYQAEAMKDRVDRKRALDRDKKRSQRAAADARSSQFRQNVPEGQNVGLPLGIESDSSVPTRPDPLLSIESNARPHGLSASGRFLASMQPVAESIPHLAQRFSDARFSAGFGRWTWDGNNWGTGYEQLQRLDRALRAETDLTWDEALGAALRGFFGDEKASKIKCPLPWLANDAGAYIAAGRTKPSSSAKESDRLMAEWETTKSAQEAATSRGDTPEADRLRKESNALAQAYRAALASETDQ